MCNLEQLKNLDLARPSTEELVVFSAMATLLHAEYDRLGVDVPEWLDTRVRELKREIRSRQSDATEKRIRELRLSLDRLKTPDEKRAQISAELARLTAAGPQ